MKLISIILVFFIFIFGPVLNKIGTWVDFIFIFSFFISLLNSKKISLLNKPPYTSFYFLIFLYIFISAKIFLYPDITLLSWMLNFIKPFRVIFTLLAGFFLASWLHKSNYSFFDLLKIVFFTITFHGLIIIVQFFNIEFRDFIYSYTTTGEFRSTFEYDFRMGGLTGGSGGAVLSTVQSLGIILVPFLLKFSNKFFFRILVFISSILIVVSIVLTGRSGIYNIIMFLPFSIYLVTGVLNSFKYTFYVFSISVGLFLFLYQLFLSLEIGDFYNSFYRTFDSFISLTETGEFDNQTALVLKDYILFPDLVTLIVGSNEVLLNYDVERNLDSDIGYVRNIFGFGIFGAIIYFLPFFNLLYFSYKNVKYSLPHKVLFILLIIMAFFHAKESFLYVRMFWSIICLILGFILVEENNRNKECVA